MSAGDAIVLQQHAERLLLACRDADLVCAVSGTIDLSVVDAVAHLRLLAGRLGARLELRAPGADLDRLLTLTGLKEAAGIEVAPPLDAEPS